MADLGDEGQRRADRGGEVPAVEVSLARDHRARRDAQNEDQGNREAGKDSFHERGLFMT